MQTPPVPISPRRSALVVRALRLPMLALATTAMLVGACSQQKKEIIRPRTVTPTVRDVPAPLRSTIAGQARLDGINPARISGIGFVVGLNGTGGQPVQEQIAAHMERQMSLLGIGSPGSFEGTPLEGVSPRQLLADRNTAVVFVEAAIPPGARKGDSYDVYVRALNASSLEGGTLWTTEMRVGPPSAFGNAQARIVGEAAGPVFINPFADPTSTTQAVTRTIGRVLNGGIMREPLEIRVLLDNPSHSRARLITSAINSAFPARSGDRGPTARGRDESLISVTVPYRYRDRRDEFAQLLRYLTVDPIDPEVYARRYAGVVRNQPEYAEEMSWALEALGEKALPFIRELYEHPEIRPRLAALRAGASLGDPRTADALITLAANEGESVRPDALRLLAKVNGGPKIDRTLREYLEQDTLITRIAAYEALAERAERAQRRRLAASGVGQGSQTRLDVLAGASLPAGTPYGIRRETIGGEFLLDRVPFGSPLIYVTQQGRPRVVLFGEESDLARPMLMTAWDNRLMMASDSQSDPVRLLYDDPASGLRVRTQVNDSLVELIEFMSREPSRNDPRPGLGLSYSEIVGALYELSAQRGTTAAFATESDKLLAQLMASGESQEIAVRPENEGDAAQVMVLTDRDDPRRALTQQGRPTGRDGKPTLVPLRQAQDGDGSQAGSASGARPTDEQAADPPVGRPE